MRSNHWSSEDHTGIKSTTSESDSKPVQQYFDVDEENDLATCRICKQSMPFTFTSVYSHRGLHRDNKIEVCQTEDGEEFLEEAFRLLLFPDHGKRRHELKLFGQENYIKMTRGGAKGYCTLCVTNISSHMRTFKQHVNGARHQGFLEYQGFVKRTTKPEKPKYTTKPLSQYAKCFVHVKEIQAFWINKAICVDVYSYMFLSAVVHENKMHCFLCDKLVSSDKIHHFQRVHREDSQKIPVITTLEDELIREVSKLVFL